MRPGIVLDAEPPIASASTGNKYMGKNESTNSKDIANNNENTKPSINCFAAILLGIKCEINGIDGNTGENTEKLSIIPTNSITDEKEQEENKNSDSNKTEMQGEIAETDDDEKIMTVKEGLIPDRDEAFINKPLFSSQAVPLPLEDNTEKSTSNNDKLGIETKVTII